MKRPQREILGHPLDKPEWQPERSRYTSAAFRADSRRDVELEGMDEFMPENMVCIGERPGKGKYDAPPKPLRYPACGFPDMSGDRSGPAKVGVASVEDERLAR
jgi:hypothetical protein